MNHRQRNSSSPAGDIAKETGSPRPAFAVGEAHQTSQPSPTDTIEVDNRFSVQTDFSIETAVVEIAEKRTLGLGSATQQSASAKEFGLLGPTPHLEMDFGSKFSLGGFGPSAVETESKHVESKDEGPKVKTEKVTHKPATFEGNNSGIKMGEVDVDMDMKSALDRLMEDVAGAGGAHADDSMTTDDYDESFDRSQSTILDESPFLPSARPKVLERAATDSALLQQNEASGVESRTVSGASTIREPPPVPPKDNITMREQLILQKRRQARGAQEDVVVPHRNQDRQSLGYGRPTRRRSLSTGDAEVLGRGAQKRGEALLDIVSKGDHDDPLADSIEKELQKLAEVPTGPKKSVRPTQEPFFEILADEFYCAFLEIPRS